MSQWEYAWSENAKRYYYLERQTGVSQWLRPDGCSLKLPLQAPAEDPPSAPPCPLGWEAVYDTLHKRFYYYNLETKDRTWYRPEGSKVQTRDVLKRAVNPTSGVNKIAAIVWDHTTFLKCMEQATQLKDTGYMEEIYGDVFTSNVQYMKRGVKEAVPKTVKVKYEEVFAAIRSGKVEPYKHRCKVTISSLDTAEAMHKLLQEDRTRVVCGVSFADGFAQGGQYKHGGSGQEEGLLRRMPALYNSLEICKHYPFGYNERGGDTAGDVLFTSATRIVRGPESEGYPIIPEIEHVKGSIVSVATIPESANLDEHALMSAITSMFVAPVLKDATTTTLVIGPWGVHGASNVNVIAKLFANAIMNDLEDMPEFCLGMLYHEIHVAVPPPPFAVRDPFDSGYTEHSQIKAVFSNALMIAGAACAGGPAQVTVT